MRAVLLGLLSGSLIAAAGCGRPGATVRDESQPGQSPTPPRSRGCDDVPNAAALKTLLQNAPSQNGDAGGLNHGKAMWGAVKLFGRLSLRRLGVPVVLRSPGFGDACRATLRDSVWSAPLDRTGQPVATFVTYTCRCEVR